MAQPAAWLGHNSFGLLKYMTVRTCSSLKHFPNSTAALKSLLMFPFSFRPRPRVVTAGADGTVSFWEDRTEEIKRERAEQRDREVEEAQTLANLMQDGSLAKAFRYI